MAPGHVLVSDSVNTSGQDQTALICIVPDIRVLDFVFSKETGCSLLSVGFKPIIARAELYTTQGNESRIRDTFN